MIGAREVITHQIAQCIGYHTHVSFEFESLMSTMAFYTHIEIVVAFFVFHFFGFVVIARNPPEHFWRKLVDISPLSLPDLPKTYRTSNKTEENQHLETKISNTSTSPRLLKFEHIVLCFQCFVLYLFLLVMSQRSYLFVPVPSVRPVCSLEGSL